MLNTKKLFIVQLLWKFIPDSNGMNLKASLLRWTGAKVGERVSIMSSAKIKGGMELIIGNDVFIGHEALIMGANKSRIQIDDYAKIGSRTVLVTGSHRFSPDGNCIEKEGTYANIHICSGAVCSTMTIVLPGKTIGKMAHCAAASVITHDVPEYTRVAGSPARVIKNFKE